MSDVFSQSNNRRNPYFENLLKEGTNTSPIKHWSQGAARLAFAMLAGLERNEQAKREREGMAAWQMQKQGQPFQPTRQVPPMPALSQQQPMPAATPPMSPPMSSPASPPASPPMFPPMRLPLMTGPSGQPVPPSGFVNGPLNIFDPRRLNLAGEM